MIDLTKNNYGDLRLSLRHFAHFKQCNKLPVRIHIGGILFIALSIFFPSEFKWKSKSTLYKREYTSWHCIESTLPRFELTCLFNAFTKYGPNFLSKHRLVDIEHSLQIIGKLFVMDGSEYRGSSSWLFSMLNIVSSISITSSSYIHG